MVKFIDLFSGIGGFRIALERLGCECVFSSEIDKYSRETYEANFDGFVHGDITEVDEKDIPSHDILVGGFPCQAFSIAGVSKNNSLGRAHGFEHEKGILFFEILRILKSKKPQAFLLENVSNLLHHDKGRTWQIMQDYFIQLGYSLHWKIIDASLIVPQSRKRIFIVGLRDQSSFEFPNIEQVPTNLSEILEDQVEEKYTLKKTWEALKNHQRRHEKRGNGFGYTVNERNVERTRTLTARYHKDGSEILIKQDNKNPRRLTPRECSRLMGFPENFTIPDSVADTRAYQQFGNSVVPGIVEEIAKKILEVIE
jgi:DNA (cytosine-5)-methyltransferase 1